MKLSQRIHRSDHIHDPAFNIKMTRIEKSERQRVRASRAEERHTDLAAVLAPSPLAALRGRAPAVSRRRAPAVLAPAALRGRAPTVHAPHGPAPQPPLVAAEASCSTSPLGKWAVGTGSGKWQLFLTAIDADDTSHRNSQQFVMDSSNASSSSASICNAGIVALRASQPTLANEGDPAANVAAVARVQVDLTQEATEDANVPPTKKAKKCSSEVWSHFDKYEKKVVGDDGTEIVELWAKYDNWCMQKRIIKFMHVEGHHSGNNLCKVFYDSVLDWNLDRKLLALTLDNASANDMAVEDWCHSSNTVIATMGKSMKPKYDKYWEKSNMALSVACFLDPRFKRTLLEYYADKVYGESAPKHMADFMAIINKLFDTYASSQPTSKIPAATDVHNNPLVTKEYDGESDDELDADVLQYLRASTAPGIGTKSELEVYMDQPLLEWDIKDKSPFNILHWWSLKQHELPILSRLAHDVLAIQVSTVASEFAFSAGGRVIDPFRSRLDPEIVQALICTKDWTAASRKGGNVVGSILTEMDMENLERNFCALLSLICACITNICL
ncbi:hypothetical protein OsI_26572 [Oryza sativa Indica Group]|uniref:HAT family dimerisation domain containing protein n=1 Tax=Oryza sativa subsp. indica TaxID=39946 RepID=B8B7Q5_ORYSI|nr:hypothetical protein OsI_26572 [Oryza sativa Indica Group]